MELKALLKGGGSGLVVGVIAGLIMVWWLEIPAEAAAVKMILILAVLTCTALGGGVAALFSPKNDRLATGAGQE